MTQVPADQPAPAQPAEKAPKTGAEGSSAISGTQPAQNPSKAALSHPEGRSNGSAASKGEAGRRQKPQPANTGKQAARGRGGKPLPVLIDVSPDPLPSKPSHWDEITVGSLVLAWDQECEAWYEVVVTNEVDGLFRIKWRDFPKQKPVMLRRDQIALLYPGDHDATTV